MYVRQPSKNIKIPENYHGNAFSPQPLSREMPPPLRQSVQERQPIGDLPPNKDLMPMSDLPPDERIRDTDEAMLSEDFDDYEDSIPNPSRPDSGNRSPISRAPAHSQKLPDSAGSAEKPDGKKAGSLFQTLLPPIGRLEEHFPFGHGIGSEEMLIMAMMLLVYLSGEDGQKPDNELLLLLGLLLFAG